MSIASILVYISSFLWILPVLRQYRENYFYFFLVLALADPVNIISVFVLNIFPNYFIHAIAGLLLFYSISFKVEDLLHYWYANIIFIILFLIALFLIENLLFIILFLHFLILIKFIKIAIVKLHQTGELNWFFLVLILYEISVVTKVLIFISATETGNIYFYLTLVFQYLIAIFFAIFREGSSLLRIRLRAIP